MSRPETSAGDRLKRLFISHHQGEPRNRLPELQLDGQVPQAHAHMPAPALGPPAVTTTPGSIPDGFPKVVHTDGVSHPEKGQYPAQTSYGNPTHSQKVPKSTGFSQYGVAQDGSPSVHTTQRAQPPPKAHTPASAPVTQNASSAAPNGHPGIANVRTYPAPRHVTDRARDSAHQPNAPTQFILHVHAVPQEAPRNHIYDNHGVRFVGSPWQQRATGLLRKNGKGRKGGSVVG